ncbi:MAG TPA: signal peptidase II [Campylobacterales bacterium]|nr:signal peptidase II [Campylobacterales bacterium]
MIKKVLIFLGVAILAITADQYVKGLILDGFRWHSDYISIIFVLNEGVAFSMLSFLQGYLKFIQVAVLLAALLYCYYEGYLRKYPLELGLILGSGVSNVYDRFIYGGVVDYVYYHHWFEFAVFNLADALIDVGVVILIVRILREQGSLKTART